MTLAVAFKRAARLEFIEAAARYEVQRDGLGVEFIAEIEHCIERAAEQPELFPLVHKQVRRVVARRFPYCIYFKAEARRIVVLSVFHGRRNPLIWPSRK